MVMPRFVLVPGRDLGGSRASWPTASGLVGQHRPDGTWFAWRLLGANNRELGRAAGVHPTAALCLDSVAQLRESLDVADLSFVCDADALSWRWRIVRDGRVLAVSGRAYQRHRECASSAALFRLAVEAPGTRDFAPEEALDAVPSGLAAPARAVLPRVLDLQASLSAPRTARPGAVGYPAPDVRRPIEGLRGAGRPHRAVVGVAG